MTGFNERHDLELTVDNLPTWPITEDDVRNNPWLVWEIARQLLTEEELRTLEPNHLVRVLHGLDPIEPIEETTED